VIQHLRSQYAAILPAHHRPTVHSVLLPLGLPGAGSHLPASTPQRAVGSGPPVPNPAVRVREEPTGRRRGPAPSPRANPGKRRRGRESYARSTASSSRSDRRETYPTPRRKCRIYTSTQKALKISHPRSTSNSRILGA